MSLDEQRTIGQIVPDDDTTIFHLQRIRREQHAIGIAVQHRFRQIGGQIGIAPRTTPK
jgi:hypothetical protein